MVLSQKLMKLEQLANKLGCIVIPGKRNIYLHRERIIVVNMRQKPLKRAWSIAHEIGHAMTLGASIQEFGNRMLTRMDHTWPSVETEFRAWCKSDKLMRDLNLYSKEYLKYKHSCMRSYYLTSK